MKKKGLLAFDLGTSGVKCSVYDIDGNLLDAKYGTYDTYYPKTDWREQAPSDWIAQIIKATRELHNSLESIELCGIGVSGHSLGALPVDKNGVLLCERVPIWSDARARAQAEELFKKVDYKIWYEKTGNGFPAELYSLFKIMWYKDNLPELYSNTYKFIGSKDYVNAYLTGTVATDYSYASGSGIYNLSDASYMEEYAQAAQVDIDKFPEIFASHEIIGTVTEKAAQELSIPEGIPVVAGGVDNACMALGAGCFNAGDTYASLGSSSWITLCSDKPTVDYNSKIYTFAHCVPNHFIPSVCIFSSGSSLNWASDNWFSDLPRENRFDAIGSLAEKSVAGANGLIFNPCLAGGSAADKSPNIRGGLFNLSLEHTREDIARAVFDGIAMHLYVASLPLEKSGILSNELQLVGGGAKGDFSRRNYADVFGKNVSVSPVQQDAASLGAAALVAVGCGMWKSFDALKEVHKNKTVIKFNKENHMVYEKRLTLYQNMCDACSDLGDAFEKLNR